MIEAIKTHGLNWKDGLVDLCKKFLPEYIKTKHSSENSKSYFDQLLEADFTTKSFNEIYLGVKKLENVYIPGIIVPCELLMEEQEANLSENEITDPTLFLRLNTEGSRISGDELIFSIYKARFPESKKLVETIGVGFISPPLVISLVSRLIISALDDDRSFPNPLKIIDFQKRIQNEKFELSIKYLVGENENSPAQQLFKKAIIILGAKDFGLPPILIKKIIIETPDLFLLLLNWLYTNEGILISEADNKCIIRSLTSLSWFGGSGKDKSSYVKEIWNLSNNPNFWESTINTVPYYSKKMGKLYIPLITPWDLRKYLVEMVSNKNHFMDYLKPDINLDFVNVYLSENPEQIDKAKEAFYDIWGHFLHKLKFGKQILLYSQRSYLIENFKDFNQLDNLEDTQTPWDLDHIFPTEWVKYKGSIDNITRHWNYTIGNLRALSLEDNRSEGNHISPSQRLVNTKNISFIQSNDWVYWEQLTARIKSGDTEMVKNHAHAIIHRLVNIYAEWYNILDVGKQFKFEKIFTNKLILEDSGILNT